MVLKGLGVMGVWSDDDWKTPAFIKYPTSLA
jgi:hypothetical protein